MFNELGRILIFLGLVLIILGGGLIFSQKFSWFGRLPGDILIKKKNIVLYFPITTSIVISIILTILFLIFKSHK